jgi:hypothetical protein
MGETLGRDADGEGTGKPFSPRLAGNITLTSQAARNGGVEDHQDREAVIAALRLASEGELYKPAERC